MFRHLPIEEDGLEDVRFIGQNLSPVRHERFPIPGREVRYLVGDWVELLLEEDGEVTRDNISQEDSICHRACLVFSHVVLPD